MPSTHGFPCCGVSQEDALAEAGGTLDEDALEMNSELQADEIEVLESIFDSEFTKDGDQFTILIRPQVSYAFDCTLQHSACCRLCPSAF